MNMIAIALLLVSLPTAPAFDPPEDPPALIDCPGFDNPFEVMGPPEIPATSLGPYQCADPNQCVDYDAIWGPGGCEEQYVGPGVGLVWNSWQAARDQWEDGYFAYLTECASCDQPGSTPEQVNDCRTIAISKWATKELGLVDTYGTVYDLYLDNPGFGFLFCVEQTCSVTACWSADNAAAVSRTPFVDDLDPDAGREASEKSTGFETQSC